MQKAKLELLVKDFHTLYDLLGHVLDHDAEAGYLDLDNLDIKLLNRVRNELFNQIPDERPTETTYAYTTVKDATSITPMKLYEVVEFNGCDGFHTVNGFHIVNDRDSKIFCLKNGCAHLTDNKSKNWNFTTITND